MNGRQSGDIVGRLLRLRLERAREQLGGRCREFEAARREAGLREVRLEQEALLRMRALQDERGAFWLRQSLSERTAEELALAARGREEAIEELRRSRQRMKQSSLALAGALALERAVARRGMGERES